MSLKPGIGDAWFKKYQSEVYPLDRVVMRGRECKPPKRYDVLLQRESAEAYDWLKIERDVAGMARAFASTAERLAVREKVTKARLSFKRRTL